MSDLLDRPMYDYAAAAHLLAMPPGTLLWWLEGRGSYRPVLREQTTGNNVLTWGEFVEARYVRAYRRDHNVSLQRIREFIDQLRDETGVRYPLATERPWVGPGRRLLLHAQSGAGLEPDLQAVWEAATGQYQLTSKAQSFFDVVEFESVDDASIARRLRPAGLVSPVVIDPNQRAGLASVNGISTKVIKELVDAGDAIEAVAEDYDLDLDTMIAALDYERTLTEAA